MIVPLSDFVSAMVAYCPYSKIPSFSRLHVIYPLFASSFIVCHLPSKPHSSSILLYTFLGFCSAKNVISTLFQWTTPFHFEVISSKEPEFFANHFTLNLSCMLLSIYHASQFKLYMFIYWVFFYVFFPLDYKLHQDRVSMCLRITKWAESTIKSFQWILEEWINISPCILIGDLKTRSLLRGTNRCII